MRTPIFAFALVAIPACAFTAAAEEAGAADYHRLINDARARLENWRTDEARALLSEADRKRPGTLLVAYYRAYCDYREGKHEAAAAGFEAALKIDPQDGWSEYMMALSLAKAGRTGEARGRLVSLKDRFRPTEIGRTAASTIEEIDALEKSSANRWAAVAETGVFADTNPAFRADSSSEGKTDAAASIAARAEYGVFRSRSQRLVLGLGAGETAYILRYEPADWTMASSWLGYRLSGERAAFLTSYRFDFAWYGYAPFTSVHSVSTGLRFSEASWTMTVADIEAYARLPHDADFDYLAARGAALSAAQEFKMFRELRIRAGYALRFEKADPAEFHQEDTAADDAGAVHLLTGDYKTDYSFFGHGPALSVRTPLPAGLSLEASADLMWRRFPHSDRVVYADGGVVTAVWEKERNDLRVYADGTVRWVFASHAAVLLRGAYLKNLSTLGDAEDDPIDRNYGRLVLGLWFRAALNPEDL
ncbi:MAG: hypothetical protein HY897_14830 [Deltaproteobacteria bacterium]|nr:hypothetical protein [Deltaproteobacteria bacterium]